MALLLLNFCSLLLPLWESVIVICLVLRYFMPILVLQSSWWGRESWLLCLVYFPGVLRWLCGLSSRCHGFVCGLWQWYLLIILTNWLLTVANLPLAKTYFEPFCNLLMNNWTSTCKFLSYGTRANALFNHSRWYRKVSVPRFGLHLHLLSERTDDKCNMSLKFSCYAFLPS